MGKSSGLKGFLIVVFWILFGMYLLTTILFYALNNLVYAMLASIVCILCLHEIRLAGVE